MVATEIPQSVSAHETDANQHYGHRELCQICQSSTAVLLNSNDKMGAISSSGLSVQWQNSVADIGRKLDRFFTIISVYVGSIAVFLSKRIEKRVLISTT